MAAGGEGRRHRNGQALREGDGAAISGERAVSIQADADAELLLFDLA